MGSNASSTILVRNFPDDWEDMPYFRVGERSLLLLKADFPVAGVFWCVGADATKRDLRGYGVKDWASMLERMKALSAVRAISNDRARAEALVRRLDSPDIDLAAAASNYLNFLATGQDDEGWTINPPKGSSDWSWDDYYRRNVVAHRKKWQNWWLARGAKP